jgi:hypothetical protein
MLEQVIGDLQEVWGIPQNPQEYRITIKVPDERDAKSDRPTTVEEIREDTERDPTVSTGDGRVRERAPAAPRMGASDSGGTPAKRRSRRRRRGRKRKGG